MSDIILHTVQAPVLICESPFRNGRKPSRVLYKLLTTTSLILQKEKS